MKAISRRDFLKGTLAGGVTLAATGAMGLGAFAGEEAVYTPGTYSAQAQGMGTVTVTMTFDEKSITDVVLDVSEESHGNAVGMGLADVVPMRMIERTKFAYMYMNAYTSKMVIPIAKMPIVAKDERDAIGVALRTCVRVEQGKERVVAIPNTLNLTNIWVSEALLPQVIDNPAFTVLGEPEPMEFDQEGRLHLFDK